MVVWIHDKQLALFTLFSSRFEYIFTEWENIMPVTRTVRQHQMSENRAGKAPVNGRRAGCPSVDGDSDRRTAMGEEGKWQSLSQTQSTVI